MKAKSIPAGRSFSLFPRELRAMGPELARGKRTLLVRHGHVWLEAHAKIDGNFTGPDGKGRVMLPNGEDEQMECMLVYTR